MSQVRVSFMGPLRKPEGLGAQAQVALPEEGTVEALLTELGYRPDERSRFRVMIEGRAVPRSHELLDGQEVTIFLPLGGG